MPLRLPPEKPITGVLAERVKISRFVMAATRAASLRPRPLRQPRQRPFISAAASTLKTECSAMDRIRRFEVVVWDRVQPDGGSCQIRLPLNIRPVLSGTCGGLRRFCILSPIIKGALREEFARPASLPRDWIATASGTHAAGPVASRLCRPAGSSA